MKTRFLSIVLILLMTSATSLRGQALKSDTIDVLNYTIFLDLKHLSHQQLYGSADLTIVPRMASIQGFSLDFRKLNIDSIILNGVHHSGYSYNDTVLRLAFTTPMTTLDTFLLRVVYHGTPLIEPYNWGGFHFLADSTLAYNLGVAFDDYPHNYGRIWFPCLDDFIDRATYDFHIRAKGTHKAVCGGMLQGTLSHPDGSITWHWRLDQPIPTYLASVAVGDFSVLQWEHHGLNDTIPITIFVRPADSTKALVSFSNLDSMLNIFEAKYGPYRWPRVGFTGTTKGAMEHAMNIAMPRNLITGNLNYDWLVAHELSHAWFGNLVTCASAEDMWINEGWARFSEAVYTEGMSGWEHYKAYIMNLQKQVLNFAHTNASGGDGTWFPLYPVPQSHTYGTTVYDKGALVAHTLRGHLGDSLFFAAVRAMTAHFAFQPMSSYQMRDFLSQHTGVNLTPFYDGWVFAPGFPHFSVDSFSTTPHAGGWNVTVFVKQKMAGRSVLVNNNVVEIGLFSPIMQREIRRMVFSGATGHQTFWLPFEPVLVLMDPEDRLSDASTTETTVVKNAGLHNFNNMFFRLRSNNHLSDYLVHIEHVFTGPDPMPQPVSGLTLSPNRYWKISGLIPAGTNLDGLFTYSTANQYDNALITNTNDSLVILYRENAGDAWHGVPFLKTPSPTTGVITVPNFRPGYYVLAKWDQSHIGIDGKTSGEEPRMILYPNPATHQVMITSIPRNAVYAVLLGMDGKTIQQETMTQGALQHTLTFKTRTPGSYLVQLLDSDSKPLATSKLTVVSP